MSDISRVEMAHKTMQLVLKWHVRLVKRPCAECLGRDMTAQHQQQERATFLVCHNGYYSGIVSFFYLVYTSTQMARTNALGQRGLLFTVPPWHGAKQRDPLNLVRMGVTLKRRVTKRGYTVLSPSLSIFCTFGVISYFVAKKLIKPLA